MGKNITELKLYMVVVATASSNTKRIGALYGKKKCFFLMLQLTCTLYEHITHQ